MIPRSDCGCSTLVLVPGNQHVSVQLYHDQNTWPVRDIQVIVSKAMRQMGLDVLTQEIAASNVRVLEGGTDMHYHLLSGCGMYEMSVDLVEIGGERISDIYFSYTVKHSVHATKGTTQQLATSTLYHTYNTNDAKLIGKGKKGK